MKAVSIKELIKNITKKFVTVKSVTVTSSSISMAANARSHVRISNAVPSGVIVLGVIPNNTPNNDWVRIMGYMDGRDLILRYHNEYTGTLSGTMSAVVTYAIVGGVLRNLSVFKAFSRFASLRKGGGVDESSKHEGTDCEAPEALTDRTGIECFIYGEHGLGKALNVHGKCSGHIQDKSVICQFSSGRVGCRSEYSYESVSDLYFGRQHAERKHPCFHVVRRRDLCRMDEMRHKLRHKQCDSLENHVGRITISERRWAA